MENHNKTHFPCEQTVVYVIPLDTVGFVQMLSENTRRRAVQLVLKIRNNLKNKKNEWQKFKKYYW